MSSREILLVEDNANDVELALRALKRLDLNEHVAVCRDGADAIDFMFATGAYTHRAGMSLPSLVLLDLKLPKIDGIEVLRRFKGDQHSQKVPVVVLTSSAQEKDLATSYALGANSFVVKPVEFDLFAQAVMDVARYWFQLNRSPNEI